MIQRIQSLYLLLGVLIAGLLFYIPLFEIPPSSDHGTQVTRSYYAYENSFLLILTVGIGLLLFVTIFLFKNRKLQMRLCRLCILLIVIMVGLLFFTSDTLTHGLDEKVTFKPGVYFPLIQLAFVFLANRSIKKDDDLVKSADRLR